MSAPRISQTTKDMALLGRRDAFHVPGVLVRATASILDGRDWEQFPEARTL